MDKIKEFYIKNKSIIFPTFVMLSICVVITGALAVTNLVTKDKIAKQAEIEQTESMKEVLKADSYAEKTAEKDGEKFTYFTADINGKTAGYIFVTTKKGYGGDVKVMTAVNAEGEIEAVKVLDVSNETPGLGQNTGKDTWYAQFSGLSAEKEIALKKSEADGAKNEINAVTGATISSTAVKDSVNTAISYYDCLMKEGN